jgi:hypothetical protein
MPSYKAEEELEVGDRILLVKIFGILVMVSSPLFEIFTFLLG